MKKKPAAESSGDDIEKKLVSANLEKLRKYFLSQKLFSTETLDASALWRAIRYRSSPVSRAPTANYFNYEYKFPAPAFDKNQKIMKVKSTQLEWEKGDSKIEQNTVTQLENIGYALHAYCSGTEYLKNQDVALSSSMGYAMNKWNEEQAAVERYLNSNIAAQREPLANIKTVIDKRIFIILTVAKTNFDDVMNIPDNGKADILRLCKNDYPDLFKTDNVFDKAWKKASISKRLSITNKTRFQPKKS